jgi:hypothetical protein
MGFSLGGIFKSLVNPMSLMQLAMGPAGWASLAMKTIGSQIAMQLIQNIGQQMGLPKSVIDLAQAAFASASGQPGLVQQNLREAVGNFVKEMDLRPSEAGQLMRELSGTADKSLKNLLKIAEKFTPKADVMPGPGKKPVSEEEETGGSWLVAMARAMGKVMDAKAAQIQEKSNSIATLAGQDVKKEDGGLTAESQKNQNKLSSETTLLQAYTQEMSMISNAATNAIKTVGEAQSTIARK